MAYIVMLYGGDVVRGALGQSEAFLDFQDRLSRAAKVDRPVLLVGERGTGKELAASRLHYLSSRWDAPFVTLNCSALSPSVLESELFGHEAGAFTGASRTRKGRFEAANGGTLFLDELGLIPISVQEKILRVVEYGRFERVGGSESIEVDVRLLGATNADLPSLVRAGKFKSDLLDRLSFEVLFLPPLRVRDGDVLLLATHFATLISRELGMDIVPEFTIEVLREFENYDWPGNIRELKNAVERGVYRSVDGLVSDIRVDPFESPWIQNLEGAEPTSSKANHLSFLMGEESLYKALERLEFEWLGEALDNANYHQAKSAELLGLSYHQFRGVYRKYKDRLSE